MKSIVLDEDDFIEFKPDLGICDVLKKRHAGRGISFYLGMAVDLVDAVIQNSQFVPEKWGVNPSTCTVAFLANNEIDQYGFYRRTGSWGPYSWFPVLVKPV